jgi:hypothetical protein
MSILGSLNHSLVKTTVEAIQLMMSKDVGDQREKIESQLLFSSSVPQRHSLSGDFQ